MLGIVAIGRNEGTRLQRCLTSCVDLGYPVVYVDSDSTDGSVQMASQLGVAVLELDRTKPLSASRARREGFRRLLTSHANLDVVFFVDGDCEVDSSWPQVAENYLTENPDVGAVCGRRRESHPEASVYNRLCDEEWDTPIGEAMSVGGDAIYRVTAYRQAGEFDPTVPAGEEPELCKRLRDSGWRIVRLDAEMTRHDAAITRFGAWWSRQIRTGYAGLDVERRFHLGVFNRIVRSAVIWGLVAPSCAIALTIVSWRTLSLGWALGAAGIAVGGFALQCARIAARAKRRHASWKTCAEIGVFTMLAKTPILIGALRRVVESLFGKRSRLVEYKSAERVGTHG